MCSEFFRCVFILGVRRFLLVGAWTTKYGFGMRTLQNVLAFKTSVSVVSVGSCSWFRPTNLCSGPGDEPKMGCNGLKLSNCDLLSQIDQLHPLHFTHEEIYLLLRLGIRWKLDLSLSLIPWGVSGWVLTCLSRHPVRSHVSPGDCRQ